MPEQVVFINTEPFWFYDYGPTHPLKMWRLRLTQELQRLYGLLDLNGVHLVEPRMATSEEVTVFHEPDYLAALRLADEGIWFSDLSRYGLGTPDCPVIPGVYTMSMLVAGASAQAAEAVAGGHTTIAFNMAGGLHHAMPSYAWGFCYINDPVVAIHKLLSKFERVAYVDIDAHHGDGVQVAFYRDPRVLTVSLHENGRYLFPGTGFETEMGESEGYGFALNVPFLPRAGDDVYLRVLDEVVLPALDAFRPQALVTQLGADALHDDPITHWNLTTYSYLRALHAFRGSGLPWVALGGGGYNIANVCRAWTLVLAVMVGQDIPDHVPDEWRSIAQPYGVLLHRLRDAQPTTSPPTVQADTERVVKWLKSHHPLLAR
ncbi:Acetoin utilization protein AcuC [bacterium HR17]|jgi:acetoin utilization protein AcuC|uniref:Acetoin utilization protein AcuC n=1 Tax=Candidatus Fervidibacter japonicus TaxID=2035412 RepID=A0A2H5X8U8_9BACT|nr:Acetoin utilization protein AcuC [bacterium HR17]